ncbi:MAG TPA: peptide chain release factor N(5)-glutamine methyltransferase [Leptolyngbyaceae cyanobacterium]
MTNDRVISGVELWQWRQNALAEAKVTDVPLMEVDWILQEVAGLDRLAIRLESFKNRPEIKLNFPLSELNRLWKRRLYDRLPVQYITGVTHWRNFSLVVSPAVLIPRPETELLIDLAVEAMKRGSEGAGERGSAIKNSSFYVSQFPIIQWADLGTGSGAIAIGLADAFPDAIVHAVDKSQDALSIAQQNAQKLSFGDRIKFYQGSWFEPLEALKGQLTGMISNPPYIPSSMVLNLQAEVTQHEPHLALDGGSDGLDCIRYLVEKAPDYLCSGGVWLIEMMAGQAQLVVDLLRKNGSYDRVEILPDLAGIERFALAFRS